MNAHINPNTQTDQNNPVFVQEESLKEELLIQKLQAKLGKPRNEIQSMLTKGLLSTLTKVPFSVAK